MKKLRNVYIHPNFSGITQGSIISGVYHKQYPNSDVFGCIITPRCDLARGIEVPTVHFLPVVDFGDWFKKDGRDVIISKGKKSLFNKLHGLLPKDEFADNIFESGLPIEVLRKMIEKSENIKEKGEAIRLFDAYTQDNEDAYEESTKKGLSKTLINELFGDKAASFYLLESWDDPDNIKVILLREILVMDKEIANRYLYGFMENEVEQEILATNNLRCSKDLHVEYEIIAQITSPIIEHIMQRFAYNFTRIGVEDKNENMKEAFNNFITKTK